MAFLPRFFFSTTTPASSSLPVVYFFWRPRFFSPLPKVVGALGSTNSCEALLLFMDRRALLGVLDLLAFEAVQLGLLLLRIFLLKEPYYRNLPSSLPLGDFYCNI